MYIIIKENKNSNLNNKLALDGYKLPSRNSIFKINGEKIKDIVITSKTLAHPFVSKIVMRKYNKLINILTELLVSDDEEGTSIIEILNMIEKFKQEIKVKYRKYLKRKELEEMANKLKFIRKKALEKQMMLQNLYYTNYNTKESNRSR